MKPPSWINTKSVCSTVVAAALVGVGAMSVDFIAHAQDSHELISQSAKTQTTMAQAVEKLAKIHEAADAQEVLYLELCLSGKLAEPNDCKAIKAKAEAQALSAEADGD
jgi:hypothetical protein